MMAVYLRRMNHVFIHPSNYDQNSIALRLLGTVYVGPQVALFCSLTDINSAREEKSDHSLSDDSQPHSCEQNVLSNLGGSSRNDGLKKPKQAIHAKDDEAANVKRCGKIMTSMLHKTYWNMKDRKLINNVESHDSKDSLFPNSCLTILQTQDFLNLEKTFYPSKKKFSKDLRKQCILATSHLNGGEKKCSLDAKELFYQGMYIKYQDPSAAEAAVLNQRFPNPEKIFEGVVHSLMEAKGQVVPEPEVTSHLKQVYWKACLTLPGSQSLFATHPERDIAVQNVYLRACEQLERLGLMWHDGENQWQPMTCEKVVSMLETLAKYIDSSFAASKGRGFKIILDQAKNDVQCDNFSVPPESKERKEYKNAITELHTEIHFQSCPENLTRGDGISKKVEMTCSESMKVSKHVKKILCDTDNDFFSYGGSFQNSNNSSVRNDQFTSKQQMQCFQNSTETPHISAPRAQWMCTVHVGWPFPFTVQTQSISLPGAQMLGYMEVASKLKTQGLLTSCNSRVSPQVLGRLMLLDIQAHWEKSLHSSWVNMQKFAADAEIFCDASITGFGAYLVIKDVEKVSWLCESWKDHDSAFLDILNPRRWMFESTLAELYATVTSVNSWKKKLRGKRLLCFSDNITAVGLINSYMEKPVKEEHCINALDLLVTSLQTTCLTYSIKLQAVWLGREQNALADLLSRKETIAFCSTVPQAACNKTRAKKLSIPWSKALA